MTIQVSYTNARQNLATLLKQAVDDLEVVVIQRRGGKNAVIISEDEFRGLAETAYLLRSPANAARLFEALERSRRGEGIKMSIDELRAMVGLGDEKA